MEKKARGRLTAPACLSTCFKMVSAFFRGEPLGYPWEGGCAIIGRVEYRVETLREHKSVVEIQPRATRLASLDLNNAGQLTET